MIIINNLLSKNPMAHATTSCAFYYFFFFLKNNFTKNLSNLCIHLHRLYQTCLTHLNLLDPLGPLNTPLPSLLPLTNQYPLLMNLLQWKFSSKIPKPPKIMQHLLLHGYLQNFLHIKTDLSKVNIDFLIHKNY